MSESGKLNEDLAHAIASIYAGPLGAFVRRRDAFAKELRAAGRREDATTVRKLRKPARLAWALNAAALGSPDAMQHLANAIEATIVAQSGSGDLRAALGRLRNAVDGVAAAASVAVAESGHTVQRADLVNAVMAVISAAGAFDTLRAGRLVEVPEAGGLDLLTRVTPAPAAPDRAPVDPATDADAGRSEARERLREAETALAAASERAATTERALRNAEAEAAAAELALEAAQRDALARQAELDRARDDAKAAAAELLGAEKVLAERRAVSQS